MLRRLLAPAALAALVVPAPATWSIVVVDTVAKEVIVASATCLANFDLQKALPVVRVGLGGAAAQSFVDQSGANRLLIWDGFGAGDAPAQILADLAASDGAHQTRQYGIVATYSDGPVTFTGTGAGVAKAGVVGQFGDGRWRYAIQGNVLTSAQVIGAARAALLQTPGDASQKVMAAMEAARALGGDGRCSCSVFAPTSCGAPPPAPFKSAHTGFVVVARLGDTDGGCASSTGCAAGDYFLELASIGAGGDPDPVLVMQAQYDAARAALVGVPDGLTTAVAQSHQTLVADGASTATLTLALADVDGVPLATGGASVSVQSATGAPLAATVGSVVDHGDGTYTVTLSAGAAVGEDTLAIVVDDGSGAKPATLAPYPVVRVDPLAALHCGVDALSVAAGGTAPLTLNVAPLAPYLVLGTLSGTDPGVALAEGVVPLNPDALTDVMLAQPGSGAFPGTVGLTDATGRAEAAVVLPPAFDPVLVGARVDLAAVTLAGTLGITNAVGFDLLP